MPHFSIIIPSYNNLSCLRECLQSIEKQNFRDFEVWIIDNCSNDGTVELLRSLEPPFFFISEKDTGIYNAMNKGVKKSKGDWLYFMGADDVLINYNVLDKISKVQKSTEKAILGKVTFNHQTKISKRLKGSKFSNLLWIKNTIHHQGIFYKNDLCQKDWFDESYKVLADYKFHLILFKKDIRVIYSDIPIANCGNEGISKKFNWSLYKEEIRLKTEVSSVLLNPTFWILGILKYILKRD